MVAPKGASESVFETRRSVVNDMPDAAPQIANVAGEAIRRYDDLKLEVAAIAQAAMLQCAKSKDAEGEKPFRQLLGRLAEDRFNLAVVGPFSRGKSSLMNAILGVDALPTGLLPHTSVITTVSYGPQERVLVRCDGWSLHQEIRLDQIAEYVTERGNPGNQRRVALAEIQLPAEVLRHGLHFIDTPGVGSAIVANTETTERFLPEIDAAIFVSSFDFAVSESDIEFLRRVRATVGVVFFVLNKLDLVSRSECEEVTRFVRERLDRELGVGCYGLFAVSAKRGLEARLQGDGRALAESGLTELEAALATFTATDKTRQLAVRVIDRLVARLHREYMRAGFALGANRSPEQISKALDDFDEEVAALKARRAELATRLGIHGNEALRAMEPRIEAAFTNLKQSALERFLPEFPAAKAFSKPGGFDVFTRDVSAFCEQALTRELRAYEAALNEYWERSAGPALAQISQLPDELFMIAIDAGGSGRETSKLVAEKPDTVLPNLEIGGPAPIKWRPRLPWWVYLAPLRWFSTKMKRQFGVALDQLLAEYRSNVDAIIRRAMTEYVDTVSREVQKAIDDRAAGMKRSLLEVGTAINREIFDQLLDRARRLRYRFDDQGQSRMLPPENGSGNGDPAVSSSSTAIGRIRACPICRAVVQAVFDHLRKLQYELSIDANAQHDHAEAGGFCSVHTWIYSSMTSPVAIARAYPALLDSHAARLERAARDAVAVEELTRTICGLSPSPESCAACAVAHRATDQAIGDVLRTLDVSGRTGMPTLCLPHVELSLRRGADLEGGRLLATGCAHALSRLANDLRRHALKHDAVRRDLMTSDERDAHLAGLRKLVGDMLLVLPPHEDDRF